MTDPTDQLQYLSAVLVRAQALDPHLIGRAEAEVKNERLVAYAQELEQQFAALEEPAEED